MLLKESANVPDKFWAPMNQAYPIKICVTYAGTLLKIEYIKYGFELFFANVDCLVICSTMLKSMHSVSKVCICSNKENKLAQLKGKPKPAPRNAAQRCCSTPSQALDVHDKPLRFDNGLRSRRLYYNFVYFPPTIPS